MITRILGPILMLFLACVSLSAQSNTGRILGTITDQSGGAIANATVIVANTQTGVARNLTSDQSGEYVAPNLLPGIYAVRATSTGFKTVDQANILLETGKDIRIDLQLSPGEVNQTVEVTTAAPLIDTTGATLGGTLSNDTINDLPLNGRNYMNLLSLRPGVVSNPGGGAWTQSTNGIRPEDQNYMVDGLNNNEAFSGQSVVNSTGTSGDAATILPIDAIQDFNVEENPRAEFGWKPGSIVNVSIKSGTNNLHGSGYAFGRTGGWDAENFFTAPGTAPASVQLEQFGGTVGGHIIKDKLFYFAGYENQRYTVGNTFTLDVPTTAAGAGTKYSIPDAEAGLKANCPSCTVNQLSLNLLSLYPPNSSSSPVQIGGFPNTNNSNNVVGKVDYHITDTHSLSVSYFFGNDTSVAEDTVVTQAAFLSLLHVRTQALSAHWTWTPNSRWVNEARVGVNRYYRPVQSADHTVPASSYGINTGVTNPVLGGMPKITISGLTQLGANNMWPNLRGPNTNYDFVDQLSYLRGAHAFKFGGEILDGAVKQAGYGSGKGVFAFGGGVAFSGSTALEDYLAGDVKTATVVLGDPTRYMSQWGYAAFVQDDWRVTRKITVNMGLRWEYDRPITAKNNQLGNWTPTAGLEQVGQQISSPYNPDHADFGPRLGVAWDLTGNGTTVVRVGGGIMYDQLSLNSMINVSPANGPGHGITVIPTGALSAPTGGTPIDPGGTIATTSLSVSKPNTWTLAGPVLPAAGHQVYCNAASPCDITAMAENFKEPFVSTWTLSVQHALTSTISLDVAYVGTHGSRLLGLLDQNQINPLSPAEIACNHCEANADRPYGAQYPYLNFINVLQNLWTSNYNGLQTSLTARNYHNFSFVAGYTYSHASDDDSHNFGAVEPENSYNPGTEYGPSDFDVRHRFTFSPTYTLPGRKTWGQLLEGWQVNGIVSLQTGAPWDAVDASNDFSATAEFRDHWDFYGNPSDFKSPGPHSIPFFQGGSSNMPSQCITQATAIGAITQLNKSGCYAVGSSILIPPALGTFGTAGRNMFRARGFDNVDASVTKNWKLERFSAQFRAEFFNLFNHPEFANPGSAGTSDPSGSNFGCGCSTPDVAATNPILGSGGPRAIQLGLKLTY